MVGTIPVLSLAPPAAVLTPPSRQPLSQIGKKPAHLGAAADFAEPEQAGGPAGMMRLAKVSQEGARADTKLTFGRRVP
jgi:hypothetical protein